MESQVKHAGGMEMESQKDDVKGPTKGPLRLPEYVLRFLAMALTLAAAVAMGLAKETETVPLQLVATLPPLPIPVQAKWSYSSAFVYFVIANAIACAYTALSLFLLIINRSGTTARTPLSLALAIADLVVLGLLYSGNGAAAAIGVVGEKGNPHVGWNKICGVFDRFCTIVGAAVVTSLLGSLLYLLVAALSIFNLHRRSAL